MIPEKLKLFRPPLVRSTFPVFEISSVDYRFSDSRGTLERYSPHLNSWSISRKEHVRLPKTISGVSKRRSLMSGIMTDRSLSRRKERQSPELYRGISNGEPVPSSGTHLLIRADTNVRFSADRALISATPSFNFAFTTVPLDLGCCFP